MICKRRDVKTLAWTFIECESMMIAKGVHQTAKTAQTTNTASKLPTK